jgi:hypothetical protein
MSNDTQTRLVDALRAALQFIENGIELRYIKMPLRDDPALQTLPTIRAALAQHDATTAPAQPAQGEPVVCKTCNDTKLVERYDRNPHGESYGRIDVECPDCTPVGQGDIELTMRIYRQRIRKLEDDAVARCCPCTKCNYPCECAQCVASYRAGGHVPPGLIGKYRSEPAQPAAQSVHPSPPSEVERLPELWRGYAKHLRADGDAANAFALCIKELESALRGKG